MNSGARWCYPLIGPLFRSHAYINTICHTFKNLIKNHSVGESLIKKPERERARARRNKIRWLVTTMTMDSG
ncbi:hypothetical protein Hanom_Chr01g00023641 [Helianthus anomalus]